MSFQEAQDIVTLFQEFQKNIDNEQGTYKVIHETAVRLEQTVREMMTVLQAIHLDSSIRNCDNILSNASSYIPKCAEIYAELSSYIPEKQYYRYHDQWKFTTQRAVFSITLIEYLKTSKLASKEDVANKLGLKKSLAEGFHLDLEDYLHGVLQLVSELSRLAVNSAASRDYCRPVAISQFVIELNAGFRLINFKNDSLRKHFDCLKYDLKKIEEVVYDLSIRGLKPSANNSESSLVDSNPASLAANAAEEQKP